MTKQAQLLQEKYIDPESGESIIKNIYSISGGRNSTTAATVFFSSASSSEILRLSSIRTTASEVSRSLCRPSPRRVMALSASSRLWSNSSVYSLRSSKYDLGVV